MTETIFFILFAVFAVAGALSLILQRNIIYSALSLIVVIGSLGGLFFLLNAAFLAILQIIIYAGAIMTLFLFVIMMVDVRGETGSVWMLRSKVVAAVLLLIASAAIWGIAASVGGFSSLTADFNVKALSRNLFKAYIFPFEIISILIISAVIGALYVAKKEES